MIHGTLRPTTSLKRLSQDRENPLRLFSMRLINEFVTPVFSATSFCEKYPFLASRIAAPISILQRYKN